MAARIREHDWSATKLGALDRWPPGLKVMVRMALTTRNPIFIFWGSEQTCLYNDAYRLSLGPEKHPSILGAPGRQALPEIWHIIGPQIEMVMRGDGATWHENQLVPILRHGAIQDVYWTHSFGPIDDEDAPHGVGGVLVICSETTSQVHADRNKDVFLATLGHELRNPLATLRNSLRLMERAPDDAAMAGRARQIMERQVEQLVRLTDDLLDVSRISLGKIDLRREVLALNSVLTHAAEACAPTIELAGQHLELAVPDLSATVCGDSARLIQLFGNVIGNASKFTPEGGRIDVIVRLDGSSVVTSVKDSGIGLAADKLDAIFEPFAQLENPMGRSYTGLGVGLALAKQLVKMHGGNIEARSAGLGHGSEFVVRLPLYGAS